MSQSWGTLRTDHTVPIDDSSNDPVTPARPENAGAWPEGMETRFYADSSLTIPGKGEKPPDCGEWRPMEFCDLCGEPHMGQHRCQQRDCPECWLTWRGNRAQSITERLAAARHAADGSEKRLTHTVVSPPKGSVQSLVEYEQMLKDGYNLANEKGVRGGVAIPHGWRVKDEIKATFRELKEADAVDGGIWQFVRENDRDWRSQTYWSPHVHVLGVGADLEPGDADADDGWVFHNVDSFSRFELYGENDCYSDMYGAAAYLLSHLGYDTDSPSHSIRWFGDLANNQFSIEELKDWEQSVVKRNAADAADSLPTDDRDGDGERECREDDCNGSLSPIWDAGAALLDKGWCDRIGSDQQQKLNAAFKWAIREKPPPAGLKKPKSRADAEEALEALL